SPRPISMAEPAMVANEPIIIGKRVPRSPTRRPAIGAQITDAAAIGRVIRPALIGDRPRTSCRYRVLRNRKPPVAAKAITAQATALENGALPKNRGSSSGSSRRFSNHTSATRDTAEIRKQPRTVGEVQ